jgi:serine/threonine protein kinase
VRFDGSGVARIAGFGLSVRVDEIPETDLFAHVASDKYGAPEELAQRLEDVGPRSDVWSLGILVHEVLLGERPYDGGAVVRMAAGDALPPLASPLPLPKGVPSAIEGVVRRCLAPRPADRFADGSEVASALRAAMGVVAPASAPRVFVSHSSKDRAWVEREIVGFLERNGVPTWYAKADIHSAEQWERTIVQGLESSPWFLLVMSPRSAESEWVRDEVFWAMVKRPSRILPVLLESCDPWKFHIRVARIQHLDFHVDLARGQRDLLERLVAPGA